VSCRLCLGLSHSTIAAATVHIPLGFNGVMPIVPWALAFHNSSSNSTHTHWLQRCHADCALGSRIPQQQQQYTYPLASTVSCRLCLGLSHSTTAATAHTPIGFNGVMPIVPWALAQYSSSNSTHTPLASTVSCRLCLGLLQNTAAATAHTPLGFNGVMPIVPWALAFHS